MHFSEEETQKMLTIIEAKNKIRERTKFLMTMPYTDYLQTPEWKEFKTRAIRKARCRCQVCNDDSTQLNVHHRTYAHRGCEHKNDVVVLCRNCHKLFHENGKLAE